MSPPSRPQALAEATRLLCEWLALPPSRVRVGNGPKGPELVVVFEQRKLVVEYAGSGDAAAVGAALAKARAHATRGGAVAVPVVAVPFMGAVGERLCAEAGASWFDLSGNARIVAPGLRVHVEGKPNRFVRRGRPSSAFAPKSARVVRRLLLEPERRFRQHELARAAGLDDGYTSRIVRRLEASELLTHEPGGAVRVRDPGLLLDAWAERYDFEKHAVLRGQVAAHGSEALLARLAKALRAAGVRHAATGLAAAWLHADFAGFRLVTLFVEALPDEALLRELGFREAARAANVWLVVPDDAGVFDGAAEQQGVACVHPAQAYVDMRAQPERATEAASALRKRRLRWGA